MPEAHGMDEECGRHPDFFEALVEVDTHATVLVDCDGRVLFASAGIETYAGMTRDEVVGTDLFGFVHPESLGPAAAAWAWMTHERTGEEVLRPFELHLNHTGTHRVVEVAISEMSLDDGSVATVMALRDVTRHALEERVTESMMSSEPIEVTLDLIVDLALRELRGGAAAIAYDFDGDSFGQGVSRGGSASLAGWCRETGGKRAGTPWAVASRSHSIVCEPLSGFGDRVVAAEAGRLGYEGCWAASLGGSLGDHLGCLVVWTPDNAPATPAEMKYLRFLAEIAGFSLDRWSRDRQLSHSARHDSLTGLPNRLRLHEAARTESADARCAALLILDLDDFKRINDDHGHLVGDQVLVEVAERFRRVMRQADVLCRLGGDEFAVVCPVMDSLDTAGVVAQRLIGAASQPVITSAGSVDVGASIGVRLGPLNDETLSAALAEADSALYEAKGRGGNLACHFGPAVDMRRPRRRYKKENY